MDANVVQGYLDYKEHVMRQVYCQVGQGLEKNIETAETSWPEHKDKHCLTLFPQYLLEIDDGIEGAHSKRECAQEWARKFLEEDVEELQYLKQHHVHIVNEVTGERKPLTACRRKDNPKLCKSDFPRTPWLINRAVVLCKALLKKLSMPCGGRRGKLGSLHGPMNHDCINATHPALLAAQRFNSDVQLPYRFPITFETHCCSEDCVEVEQEK